jgi:HPt (histidine-containing phosphotransfer) domain-containing protein
MIEFTPQNYSVKDLQALKQLEAEVGKEILSTLIDVFLKESQSLCAKLHTTLKERDISETTRLLHSIKSGAKTYGASRLAALSAELEARARANDLNTVEQSIVLLEDTLNATLQGYAI